MSTAKSSSAAAYYLRFASASTPAARSHSARALAVPRGPAGRRPIGSSSRASGADGGPGDRLASGLLGGASRDLADALDVSDDPDAVVEALGMRANLLDADDEARARQRAMDNLGSLMASGQAGALNAVPPDLLPMLLRLPSTSGNVDALRQCADGINDWKASLARGLLPSARRGGRMTPSSARAPGRAGRPGHGALHAQFPPVLDTLMKNILDILYVYEQQKADEDGTEEEQSPRAPPQDGGGSGARTATTASRPRMATPEGDGGGGGADGDDDAEGAEGNAPGAVVAMTTATTGMGVRLTWQTSISPWRVRRMGTTTAMTPRARRRARRRASGTKNSCAI